MPPEIHKQCKAMKIELAAELIEQRDEWDKNVSWLEAAVRFITSKELARMKTKNKAVILKQLIKDEQYYESTVIERLIWDGLLKPQDGNGLYSITFDFLNLRSRIGFEAIRGAVLNLLQYRFQHSRKTYHEIESRILDPSPEPSGNAFRISIQIRVTWKKTYIQKILPSFEAVSPKNSSPKPWAEEEFTPQMNADGNYYG